MALLNPETIFRTLFSMLGISSADAAQIAALMQRAPQFIAQLEAEMAAFKRGTADMVGDFHRRLDALDARLAGIETLLADTRVARQEAIAHAPNGVSYSE
jgi:hypothetical protein